MEFFQFPQFFGKSNILSLLTECSIIKEKFLHCIYTVQYNRNRLKEHFITKLLTSSLTSLLFVEFTLVSISMLPIEEYPCSSLFECFES